MLGTVLIVVMIMMLFGPLPAWPHRRKGEVFEKEAVNRSRKILPKSTIP
ncbi:MAG: DUF3309 domain-containing protein [Geobacter sp.]|nr:MAG: DUF3309 domain-containing protein [Geobacter sp.]